MAAIPAGVGPRDEVIMPSYTFVSTANAFVLRGATKVFVDTREYTQNIDECLIEVSITERTKGIVPVHSAGVGCETDTIIFIAERHDPVMIEDADQRIMANYRSRPLGSIGHLGALPFHDTKNIISSEGWTPLVDDASYAKRAEIIREKGTNRSEFFCGEVRKYTWVDIGTWDLSSKLTAAFLIAQLKGKRPIISIY